MRVPLRWLRELVDFPGSAEEIAAQLTLSGTEVGTIHHVGAQWDRIVIARVESIEPHPSADHLFVARVRTGGDPITIVTGAPNLKPGDVVPLVLVGGSLGPNLTITQRSFRGIASEGMLCSGDELGISPDKEHIYVLEPDAPVGMDLRDFLADDVLDVELTPNRPDCTGILGIAREVSALTGAPLIPGDWRAPAGARPTNDAIKVFVDDPDLCPRYTAAYLEGARVGESPLWMQRRLHQAGMRPISNLVDVTNYVMFELGQPLHAFDADRLRESTIRVRRAHPGERLTTIDGIERELPADTLLIADESSPIALAGIMGGLDSEISERTTRVVLESATFDRLNIRRSVQALRVSTEASKRFDKGLDVELPPIASHRAMGMMLALAGGAAGSGLVDLRAQPPSSRSVTFSGRDVANLIGTEYSAERIGRVLTGLGFELQARDGAFTATIPTWRSDVGGKADIAEEVARISGYDAIPTLLPDGRLPAPREEPPLKWAEVVRTQLASAGLQEVITYSLVDPHAVGRLDASAPYPDVPPDDTIALANPMSADRSRLRSTLLPSALTTIGENLRYQPRVWLFEISKVFLPPLAPLPTEERRLVIAMAGVREPAGWASGAQPTDFYDLKAAVEAVFHAVRAAPPTIEPGSAQWLHPGRAAVILTTGGKHAGYMGQVHPRVAERFDIENVDVYAAELDFDVLIDLARDEVDLHPLPRYPAVERDLAIVLDESVPHREVETAIRVGAGPLLDSLTLFDLYRGAQVPEGKRSLAYALSFRAPDRTLAEAEVTQALDAIVAGLEQSFNASIRGRE